MGGDISGVFGKDVSDNLVNGVISFLAESIINSCKNCFDFFLFIFSYGKGNGRFVHGISSSRFCILQNIKIITYIFYIKIDIIARDVL
jgi:hypothetical protein